MASHIKKSVQLSALCIAIACVHTQALALENLELLDDEMLAESTGEGIGFLPENFSMRMNGVDDHNTGQGTFGAGYARLIPVGSLTPTAIASGYQKADGWLYGVSLGQSKKDLGVTLDASDWGVPFGGIGTGAEDFGREITSWGTPENPWIFKTLTDHDVPNFKGEKKSVSYMTLEAPLYHESLPQSGSVASSAYNLKLGFWTDFMMRDPAVAENGYDGLSERLRLGFVWDGFSVNGSNLKIFQTLGGVVGSDGGEYTANLKINGINENRTFNYGMRTDYNQTFGLAGVVRLNSRATNTARGTFVFGDTTRQIIQLNYDPLTNYDPATNTRAGSYSEGAVLATHTATGNAVGGISSSQAEGTNSSNGLTMTYTPMTNGERKGPSANPAYSQFYPGSFYDGGICSSVTSGNTSGSQQFGQCLTQEGFTTRRFKVTGSNSWTAPKVKSVIRLSTQEKAGATLTGGTPALGGSDKGAMPNFGANNDAEGIFLYDANINLVLGSLYQPLMLNTDGSNFSIEIARIPNVKDIYTRIYTRYAGDTGDAGVTYLGSTCNVHQCGTSVVADYQGSSATHSSITIGSTEYDPANNLLTAHSGLGAYGVSIGALGSTGELGSTSEVKSTVYEDYTQVWKRTRETEQYDCNWLGNCKDRFTGWGGWSKVSAKSPITDKPHPSLNRPNPYETTMRQNYNNQVQGIHTNMPVDNMANTINNMQPIGGTVGNNFGSAVVDGLLIQHAKFSTTGL